MNLRCMHLQEDNALQILQPEPAMVGETCKKQEDNHEKACGSRGQETKGEISPYDQATSLRMRF